jgi:hypothetical protein
MPLSIQPANLATHLLSNGSSVRKNQVTERFRNMKVGNRCSSGPPSRIKSWLPRAFHSVKIHPPSSSGIKSFDKTLHRDRQHRNPSFVRFVQDHASPQTALQIVFFARGNVQVDPHSVGADFELFITPQIRRIGLQKYFGDVVVPQLVAAAAGLRVRKYCDDAVFRLESQMQRFRSPQQPYFRFALRIGVLALPIRVESQCFCMLPRRWVRKSLGIGTFWHSKGYRNRFIHCKFVFIHPEVCTDCSASQNSGCHPIHN